MKRLCVSVFLLLAFLAGCSTSQISPTENSSPATSTPFTSEIPESDLARMEAYMGDLCDRIYEHNVSVYEYEGGFSIHVSMSGTLHESTFVDFVFDGTKILQRHLPEFDSPLHEFTVTFTITDPSNPSIDGNMIWSTKDLVTGVWGDTAYGRTLFVSDATLTDLTDTYDCVVIYPSNSCSKYLQEATQPIPDILFDTTAEENGLAGTVYVVSATILERKQSSGLDMVIAEYNGEQFAVADFMGYASGIDSLFLQTDPSADYSLPPVNATVTMYLTYRGFSGTLDLPIFFLGANEYCVDAIRGE